MIQNIQYNGYTWYNIVDLTKDDLDFLYKKYKFHSLDLEDCMSKVQRPKIEEYDDYKFYVLHFPTIPRKGLRLRMEEVDIFWGRDYIVTIHNNHISKLTDFYNMIESNEEIRKKYFSKGPDYLLYRIIRELVNEIFPLMTRFSHEIDWIDSSFETMKPSKVIERISALRRNLIFIQTSLKPQKSIFSYFENALKDQEEKEMDIYWGDIGDYIGKILDMAEDYQELLEGLYSSIDTLLTFRMNNIMKTLTIFSVIMLPLTFITSMYGMNIQLPFMQSPHAFGVISGVMGSITLLMIIFFKFGRF
ncbi:MAG: magnesium transporter CorA family protein [Spirochaetes bacterium]|nr:magnesium transporter CorA family protein [Spirochaetota bacterium]